MRFNLLFELFRSPHGIGAFASLVAQIDHIISSIEMYHGDDKKRKGEALQAIIDIFQEYQKDTAGGSDGEI